MAHLLHPSIQKVILVFLLLGTVVIVFAFSIFSSRETVSHITTVAQLSLENSAQFVPIHYLPKIVFKNSPSSSRDIEFSLKAPLPKASDLTKNSTAFPVYGVLKNPVEATESADFTQENNDEIVPIDILPGGFEYPGSASESAVRNVSNSTKVDRNNKINYVLREPQSVFDDIKSGIGDFAFLRDLTLDTESVAYQQVEIDHVELMYYHEKQAINEPEFYQPVYVFAGVATVSGMIRSTKVVAPAVLTRYATQPKPDFLLRLGAVTPQKGSNAKVYLSWEEVPQTTSYRLFSRSSSVVPYTTSLLLLTEARFEASIDIRKDTYFIVQACNEKACFTSNEVVVKKQ